MQPKVKIFHFRIIIFVCSFEKVDWSDLCCQEQGEFCINRKSQNNSKCTTLKVVSFLFVLCLSAYFYYSENFPSLSAIMAIYGRQSRNVSRKKSVTRKAARIILLNITLEREKSDFFLVFLPMLQLHIWERISGEKEKTVDNLKKNTRNFFLWFFVCLFVFFLV